MPEFKYNGKTYCGSSNQASAISYVNEDGSKTTVQDKINELNRPIEFNKEEIIGTLNGKPVYQILLTGTLSMPSTSSFSAYTIDFSSLNIDQVISYSFILGNYLLPWISESSGNVVTYIKYLSKTGLTIGNQQADWSAGYLYRLLLYYTKA